MTLTFEKNIALCFIAEFSFACCIILAESSFMNYDRRLSVNLQSSLSQTPSAEMGIYMKELMPRKKLREEHVLLTIDFPGTDHEFTFLLERARGRVTIATKEWGKVRMQHLPVEGLSDSSYHRGLYLHITPSTVNDLSRLKVYLDCKWQGYFLMPLSLFQMAQEAAERKLRAEKDRKIKIQVFRNSSLQNTLEEIGCQVHGTQAIQPSIEIYGLNEGEDQLLKYLKELTGVLRDMRRNIDTQTKETKLLRSTLEKCKGCKAPKHLCVDNPCYPGVQCTDTADGFWCGTCPAGFIGDGVKCKKVITCKDKPCHEGVECFDVDKGYRCGSCPPRFTGNGLICKQITQCSDNPCWHGVKCSEIQTEPGYLCGSCPVGFLGNGTHCKHVEQVHTTESKLGCNKHDNDYLFFLRQRSSRNN